MWITVHPFKSDILGQWEVLDIEHDVDDAVPSNLFRIPQSKNDPTYMTCHCENNNRLEGAVCPVPTDATVADPKRLFDVLQLYNNQVLI